MIVRLAYGRGQLEVDLPEDRCHVIEPTCLPGIEGERRAIVDALDRPTVGRPLREWIRPGDNICIVFTDITRATPNDRLIPWLLEYLSFVPKENITLLNSVGTHRPNTPDELDGMLTPQVARRYQVVNHEPENDGALVAVGSMHDGTPALLNRHLVNARVRIITGFIEPHFFAGYSGGPKGIIPGVAGLQTIRANHDARNIGHPEAAFGITHGNPLWEEICDVATRIGPSFLLNVTLNHQRQITGVFTGDLLPAHSAGTTFVQRSAMQEVPRPYDIVVTTNSGFPLDLNLYQGIKGLAAGARIVKDNGLLLLACECREGIPSGSAYDRLLRTTSSPRELLARISTPGFSWPEQWQVQIQARIQQRTRTQLFSALSDEDARAAQFEPCHDIGGAVRRELARLGPGAQVAVLPQGPLTIPVLAAA